MKRAKAGEWVTCINDKYVKASLTKGEDYLVECTYQNYPAISAKPQLLKDAYVVVCDDGLERVYDADRFCYKGDKQAPD